MAAPAAVAAHGLTKDYGSRRALDGIDLDVSAGSVTGLVGPNGAGKTTTLRLLLDVIRPTAGTVRVLGEEPRAGGPALRRRIGYLPGDLRLDGRSTGRELLRLYARLSGADAVRPGAAEALAERLGADLHRPVRSLSKGNRQKIGLVQAFQHAPELLVLDEPTSGLDPLVQQEFLALVREARDAGRTVLLRSHVLSELEAAADAVVVLRAGRVATTASVAALRSAAVRRVRVAVDDGSGGALRSALQRVPGLVVDGGGDDDGAGSGGGAGAGGAVEASLSGGPAAVGPLVRALQGLDVRDLVISEPDLEQAVMRFYDGDGDGDGDGAGRGGAPR